MNEEFVLNIPSNIIYVEAVIDLVRYFLEENYENQSIIDDEIASLTEAISNAIIHGNKQNKKRKVSIKVKLLDDKIVNMVEDSNSKYTDFLKNYNYSKENIYDLSGRGLHIIKSYMDNVKVKKGNRGNILKMTKKVNGDS
jgi:serine/threonine-protein kinase RsbW